MLSVWKAISLAGPVALIFDDLHWADEASIDLLNYLFQLTDQVKLMVLCTFRPERGAPVWRIKNEAERSYPHRYLSIELHPLLESESSALLRGLLNSPEFPEKLQAAVLQKTEGNPFFIEELIHSFIENGTLVKINSNEGQSEWYAGENPGEIEIPDSIQSLILARVDRLDEESRQVLQIAAVLGRTFSIAALKLIFPESELLMSCLNTLERAELIRETARQPKPEYAFRHTLTQETVYNAILLKQRRKYHLLAGEALEIQEQASCEATEACAMLAYHFDQAGDDRALRYYQLAGDHAFQLYANREAIKAYTRAIELANNKTESDRLEQLFTKRGRAYELSSAYQEALENYADMKKIAEQRHDEALVLAALIAQATLMATPSSVQDFPNAREISSKALEIAQKLENKPAEAKILWIMLLMYDRIGLSDEAIHYGERALKLALELDLQELVAYILNDLGQCYYNVGQFQLGREVTEQAVQIWASLDNKAMHADSLSTAVLAYFLTGDYKKAIQTAEEALKISIEIKNLWGQAYSRMYVGMVYVEMGEFSRAIESMKSCLYYAEKAGFAAPKVTTQIDLARLFAELGDYQQALELVEDAKQQKNEYMGLWKEFVRIGNAHILAIAGRIEEARTLIHDLEATHPAFQPGGIFSLYILLLMSDFALAERDWDQLMDTAENLLSFPKETFRGIIPLGLLWRGKALLETGRFEEALTVLETASSECEALGAKWIHCKVLVELISTKKGLGTHEEAEQLTSKASILLTNILEGIDSPELRDSFLRTNVTARILTIGTSSPIQ